MIFFLPFLVVKVLRPVCIERLEFLPDRNKSVTTAVHGSQVGGGGGVIVVVGSISQTPT